MFLESISASRQIGHDVTLGRQALQVTWPFRHAIRGGRDSLEHTGHSRLAFSSSSTLGVSEASPMLACTADSRLKARRVDTELVDGVGSRELAECINGSPMSIASSAVAAAAALAEAAVGASPLFLGPFLCALGGGDSARITGTSTTSSSSSSSSEVSRSSSAAAAAAAAEDGAFSWARIGFGVAGRTCRMVEEEDPEPEGRGMGPEADEVPASGFAFPLPDFLFRTKMGLGGPGCCTTTFPLSLFVCAAVDAPRARFERVLQKGPW